MLWYIFIIHLKGTISSEQCLEHMCIWNLCTLNLLTLPIGICADYIVLLLSLDVRSYVKNSCTSLWLVADLQWLRCILIVTCKVACVLFLMKVSFFYLMQYFFFMCERARNVVGSVVPSRSIEKVWRSKNAADVFAHEDERRRASSAWVEHAEPFNMPPVLNSIFTAYPIFPLLVHGKKKCGRLGGWSLAQMQRPEVGSTFCKLNADQSRSNPDKQHLSSPFRSNLQSSFPTVNCCVAKLSSKDIFNQHKVTEATCGTISVWTLLCCQKALAYASGGCAAAWTLFH